MGIIAGGNVRVISRNQPKLRSAGASVLPSHHKPGDNGVALRVSHLRFPIGDFPRGEGTGQLMRKKEKEVRENKQPSRNPLHADGWFVLQGDEEPLHVASALGRSFLYK